MLPLASEEREGGGGAGQTIFGNHLVSKSGPDDTEEELSNQCVFPHC